MASASTVAINQRDTTSYLIREHRQVLIKENRRCRDPVTLDNPVKQPTNQTPKGKLAHLKRGATDSDSNAHQGLQPIEEGTQLTYHYRIQ